MTGSLTGRLTLLMAVPVLCAIALSLALREWTGSVALAGSLTGPVLLFGSVWAVRRATAPVRSLLRALAGTVTSYRDGEYAFSIRWDGKGELGELVAAHNELGDVLRQQRLGLVQRELLLDSMVQNAPIAMILTGPSGRVVYANIAARRLLWGGRRLEGTALQTLLDTTPPALREAMDRGGDGLFTVSAADHQDRADRRDAPSPDEGDADAPGTDEHDDEVYHLARRRFQLNGGAHELILLRHLTAELRRQEVRTWKKVIRVISHELNNSLAPIASLAHSGAELLRREQGERVPALLATIEERARHLEGFIRGYATFAKLPAPRLEPVGWPALVAGLREHISFESVGEVPALSTRVDRGQIEQALLNLLKNAHESGSAAGEIGLQVRRVGALVRVEVRDRGSGMSERALASALVPFYSTKRDGTGLGLAVAREIVEAHGGRIALANRDGGGLSVTLTLPV